MLRGQKHVLWQSTNPRFACALLALSCVRQRLERPRLRISDTREASESLSEEACPLDPKGLKRAKARKKARNSKMKKARKTKKARIGRSGVRCRRLQRLAVAATSYCHPSRHVVPPLVCLPPVFKPAQTDGKRGSP